MLILLVFSISTSLLSNHQFLSFPSFGDFLFQQFYLQTRVDWLSSDQASISSLHLTNELSAWHLWACCHHVECACFVLVCICLFLAYGGLITWRVTHFYSWTFCMHVSLPYSMKKRWRAQSKISTPCNYSFSVTERLCNHCYRFIACQF